MRKFSTYNPCSSCGHSTCPECGCHDDESVTAAGIKMAQRALNEIKKEVKQIIVYIEHDIDYHFDKTSIDNIKTMMRARLEALRRAIR